MTDNALPKWVKVGKKDSRGQQVEIKITITR